MIDIFGFYKIIVSGCILALITCLFILKATLFISVLGFALLGTGLFILIPELLKLAEKTERIISSRSISFVAIIGFMGFLIDPITLLFFISNYSNLRTSFVFLAITIPLALIISIF